DDREHGTALVTTVLVPAVVFLRELHPAHRPVPAWTTACSSPPRSNASCSAATAVSSWSGRQSTEMRISEVFIVSMLIPALDSASQNVAVTPGCERIPAPTSETFPTSSSCRTSPNPISGWAAFSASTARGPSVRGSVNVMSVRRSELRLMFCSTMSMLISASATVRKIRAAMPGVSGTSVTVIFASDRSWATPAKVLHLRAVEYARRYNVPLRVQDLRPARGHLEHLLVGDGLEQLRVRDDARVGGV